jgi:hypothetical protein
VRALPELHSISDTFVQFAYIHGSNEGGVDYKRFEHLLLLWSVPHALVAWS